MFHNSNCLIYAKLINLVVILLVAFKNVSDKVVFSMFFVLPLYAIYINFFKRKDVVSGLYFRN